MNVELAKTAGFCFGVKRAVDTVYKQIEKHQSEKIFTYGPIIHNEEVIKDLRSHGVEVLNDEEELKTVDADVVVIRSHGVDEKNFPNLVLGSDHIICSIGIYVCDTCMVHGKSCCADEYCYSQNRG